MTTTTPPSGGSKADKFASAAGSFVGSAASGFVPPVNITVNSGKGAGATVPGPRSREGLLPAPEFTSPAQIREYCNTLRAAAVTLSIEVAMGAEILKAVLATVPDPEGRIGGSKVRAFKVARKLQRSADELRNAAKLAAATYAAFAQEYEGELNAHRARARRPQQPRMTWTQQ